MNHPHHAIVGKSLGDAHRAIIALMCDQNMVDTIAQAGAALGAALKAGHRVFSCGNGGSMADAMHFAEELTGRYRQDRPPLAATAISDPTHLSCVANDYGYDQVFARYVRAHGRPGDWLLAISTSGKSENVLAAVDVARAVGMHTIGLTAIGFDELIPHGYQSVVDFDIRTGPIASTSDRVQELHIKVIHILVELVERVAFDIDR